MAAPRIQVEIVDDCVAVIRPGPILSSQDWPGFEAAYRHVYDTLDHFVLAFDLQQISMPPVDMITSTLDLITVMRPRTSRQVIGVVVLTPYESVCKLVSHYLKVKGQVAPFHLVSDARAAAQAISRMANIIRKAPGLDPTEAHLLTFGELSFGCYLALLVLTFMRMQVYFIGC
jgi:hypothetical protein